MYEDKLGTGWGDISGEEAIRRAYALGVAACFGYENDEELERLLNALDSSYDRSIIDLAYREGRQEATVVRDDSDAGSEEDVWTRLVEGVRPDGADADVDAAGPSPAGNPIDATDFPAALDRAGLLSGGRDLDALGFPDHLGAPSPDDGGSEP